MATLLLRRVAILPQYGNTINQSTSAKVSYCMRTHRVERFLDDFERLHAKLTYELIILPTFPEGGELSSLFGKWIT